jgi:hypothetical protein
VAIAQRDLKGCIIHSIGEEGRVGLEPSRGVLLQVRLGLKFGDLEPHMSRLLQLPARAAASVR